MLLKELTKLFEADRPDFPGMDKKMIAIGKKNGVDFGDTDGASVKSAMRDCYSEGYKDGYNSAPRKVREALEEAAGPMPIAKFKSRFEADRVKLLWQWATSKQMDLKEWTEYLEEHCSEVAHQNEMGKY